jgi:hypothetical protein
MTKSITQRVKSKISSLSDGVAFASNSFHFVNANKNSIEKELSNLTAPVVSNIIETIVACIIKTI